MDIRVHASHRLHKRGTEQVRTIDPTVCQTSQPLTKADEISRPDRVLLKLAEPSRCHYVAVSVSIRLASSVNTCSKFSMLLRCVLHTNPRRLTSS